MFDATSLTIIFSIIFGYIIYSRYKFFTYWQSIGIKSIPGIPIDWAFKPFQQVLIDNHLKYGKIYGMNSFNTRLLIYNDPKVFRDVSIKQLSQFPMRFINYMGRSSLIYSLFFMRTDSNWKRIRSVVSPAFTSGKLKSMLTPIDRIVKNFIGHLERFSESGELFDVKLYTSAFAMDVISSCAYGINIDSLSQPNHPIVTNARRILSIDTNLTQFICFMFPSIARFLNLSPFDAKSCAYFDDLTFEIIEKRSKQQSQQQQDLIGLMMEQMDKSSSETTENFKGISREEIAGQGIIFFLAGYDTTNVTFCHIIYNLIKYPEWQDKLLKELKSQQESLMDYELLRSLPILNAIINETLRLYPPLLVVSRSTDQDTMLLDTGIKIPANTALDFHPYIMHRDPEYFPDPESFKPERFIGENSAENSIAFVPFGVGPRLCVGMRFALNELRVAVSQLILNYQLVPDPQLKLDYYKGSIIFSQRKVMIRIQKR